MPRKGEGPVNSWLRDVAFKYVGSACLVGPASTLPNGYAQANWGGKKTYVHAVVCDHFHGPRPSPDHEAAHSCNTRACGNGDHLAWKTHADNMADQVAHGTLPRGERNPNSVLSAPQVRAIIRAPNVRGVGASLV